MTMRERIASGKFGAVGNPCKTLRAINEDDMKYYYKDRGITEEDLGEEARLRKIFQLQGDIVKKKDTAGKSAPTSNTEITKRVKALLKKMSLAEKVGQLAQIGGADWNQGPKPEEIIRKSGTGKTV